MEERKVGEGMGNANIRRTEVYVGYNYHVLDIPAWVTHSQKKLDAIYPQFKVLQEDVSYPDTKTFYKGKDGNLYQDSLSYWVIPPSGKLLESE
ncbi:hypothetical protein [Orbus hercynius]|uniref:hypothetical protein n=1 Tax=Orbus hercynius TaxID=593135 RepID=UPI0011C45088|nr:hypothetical protein [Orbus hercynius]